MDLDLYIAFTRYLTTFVFSFFIYQLFASLVNYTQLKEREALWPMVMCLTTAAYCFVFAFNTHFINQKLSDFLLMIFWVCAYSSFYSYIRTIEVYLKRRIKKLEFAKLYCVFLVSVQIVCAISTLLFNHNFLFDEHNYVKSNLFAQTMHFNVSPNIYGKILGGLGALVVLYTCIVIWIELNRLKRNEVLLKLGIIVTFLAVLNDTALGLEISGAILPLYYFGNAFEAVRFNLYFQRKVYRKLFNLENEVVRLSRIAQFGFAAASIAHDIRNHIFVLKIGIDKLIKGREEDPQKNYKSLNKHINKVSEITDLYMNVFDKNNANEKNSVSVKKIVDEAIELVAQKFQNSNVVLIVDIEDFSINCNETEITISIVNLLKNALEEVSCVDKYQSPWVQVHTYASKRSICVTDCGQGISNEIASEIFNFGYSTKKAVGGHGVGLAITKALLKRSGFQLGLLKDSKNTTFEVLF
ncbi:GHKL domain protein [Halobacteriovorax sp. BALOs_7]|uniref:ATP-binding protein n=1 Tax=Halobacteriovorax sp. BALOs_7 TaxID=2109558 RepID=UPI000EA1A03D|nr:HAMP domain-containing sensor histidine kinase [Halobacteriovorax sp. BALOs_7]AYF45175.1 GHKL domain protein [Halobacteriovorax sp. BALOs_7]